MWLEAWRGDLAFVCGVSPVVHRKTTGGSLVEPKAKSGGSMKRDGVQAGLTAQEGRFDRVAAVRREASKRRTHSVIEVLASEVRKA